MKESIYLETTVVSYYTSKLSRDVVILAHQQITREWWPRAVTRFDVLISEIVIEEASLGDPEAAKRRLEELKDFPLLELSDRVREIAEIYMEALAIPERVFGDAIHLAVASVYDVDYLVTWNCAHIANAELIKKLMKVNESLGIHSPIICTPEELMEG
jgi:predicted nucleic acid-binding protein